MGHLAADRDAMSHLFLMGLDATKPVFRVSEKRDSILSPQLQRLARKLKFCL